MTHLEIQKFIKTVLKDMPADWLNLTTHRLDIFNEKEAKFEFLEHFENLYKNINNEDINKLPTAFDYIRLGHPLSCVLEWMVAKLKGLDDKNIISFSSQTMPILAILRKNLLENINTQIIYKDELPNHFDIETLKNVYGYKFEVIKLEESGKIPSFNGKTIILDHFDDLLTVKLNPEVDFVISIDPELGSIALVNGAQNESYISEIQHVRRRESIAMTPRDCFSVLEEFVGVERQSSIDNAQENKKNTINTIKGISNTSVDAEIGSSGLSVQYAIMMGLVHYANENHHGKDIKFIVPPNCYGGTNDQARRVAACIENVEILDLPVDREHDMVSSVEKVLDHVASIDAVPFIIAEIPTNPRVEVPDLKKLTEALVKKRKTSTAQDSIAPVFIIDQTFCPNMKMLGDQDLLAHVKTLSYVSGSKFPSGGLCTAGYCVANKEAKDLMSYIGNHLKICNNEATDYQIELLSKQMPSMLERINHAYKNTRSFVEHIYKTLPEAKINFVSDELAEAGFTPSVFSLDLPTIGETHEDQETYKRDLNYKLINLMISEIPQESKHCVSYGQLKGCYWTIPATSTQGTTKEGDKDYIVRVAVSPDLNLEKHKEVFSAFCEQNIN